MAWLVPSDVPDGPASPCLWAPAPGGSGSLQVSPKTVGAVDQGGPRGGGGNGDRSRPCGPSAQQTKQGVWRGSSAGTQNTTPVLGPGSGATGEQTPHCAGPASRLPGKSQGLVFTRAASAVWTNTRGLFQRNQAGGRREAGEDGEPGQPGVLRPLRQHPGVHHSLCKQVCFFEFSNNVMDQSTHVSWVRRVPVGLAGAPAGKPESPADEPLGPTPRTPLTFKHRTRNCLHILVSFQRNALSPVSYPWVQKVTHRPLAHM